MRKILVRTISIIILIMGFLPFLTGHLYGLAGPSPYGSKAIALSELDLRKYFEKAMSLFESARYKEAIIVFENLIEIEKSQNESYFTPFAEIYIEKAKTRMQGMLVLEDRKWQRLKKDVIDEAERIARQEAEKIAREEQMRRLNEERVKKEAVEDARKKETHESEEEAESIYEKAMQYYREKDYPRAIIEFKKIGKIASGSRFVDRAEAFIKRSQEAIKEKEERGLLVRMEAARMAKIEVEKEERRSQLEKERESVKKENLERGKARLKIIFRQRLQARMARERILRTENLTNIIRKYMSEQRFEEAEGVIKDAIAEFPENEKFRDILHYVELQKLKLEEKALKRTREIVEEKMLLEVAEKHIVPPDKTGELKKDKDITPLVKVPEIRKKLKIPISVDFKDVELDYVLGFLSEATGVNIVPSSAIDMQEKKVTIKIKDMPLEDALRYILKSQELIYRIEEDAVWIATKEELDNEKIDTRIYFLNQGIGRFAEFSATGGEGEGTETVSTEVKTVKDILEEAVDWPKDAKLTLDDRTGSLIVSNIPSNLEIIEDLLYNLDVTPVQVLIEAKFLEVQVTDVDELGIEWKLNSAWGVKQNNAKQNLHGFASGSGADFSSFTRGDQGFNLTYQGILSHPQFQVVMHALKEKQDVKTLSAPRITTLNNQTATIEVIDEYIYPTRYEVSLVQFDINGDGDFDDAGETEWANIPQDFVTRNVGILLHVKPSIGVDKKTITLALTPEVSETGTSFTYSGEVTIPQFKTRNLSTSIMVQTGETVVLGGLIKETNTNVKTKVPLLGDLPLFGALFRKNTESIERRNLLIFVTATVLGEEEEVLAKGPEIDIKRREQ